MNRVQTYDPSITQCCIDANQKGPFPIIKGLHYKKLPCSTHRLTVRSEPLLQTDRGCSSPAVGPVWWDSPGRLSADALRAAGRQHPSEASREKLVLRGADRLSPRSASDLGQVIASTNATWSLFWSSDDQRSCRQRSAFCSILNYVIQITDVMPKQAPSVVSLNWGMSRA